MFNNFVTNYLQTILNVSTVLYCMYDVYCTMAARGNCVLIINNVYNFNILVSDNLLTKTSEKFYIVC